MEKLQEILCREQGEEVREIRIIIKVEDLADEDAEMLKQQNDDLALDNNLTLDQLMVYPNPATGPVNISFDLAEQGDVNVRIFDLKGTEVFSEDLDNFQGKYSTQVDLGNQSEGIFFLNVVQNGKSYTRKIVTQ